MRRKTINQTLQPEILVIYNIIPIESKQSKLILGDSFTEKDRIAVKAIINEANLNYKVFASVYPTFCPVYFI
ncbi:MAG: hypothetical protein LBB45_08970 [Methanobrevibacter sp.]|jgi:F0F1-type ATP synthase alpha subunit|nr:hypothetical protein [Candidatus Methanovirga basalitermitum]